MTDDSTTTIYNEQYQISYEESTLRKERRMRCIEAAVSLANHSKMFDDLGAETLSNRVRSMADDFYNFVQTG